MFGIELQQLMTSKLLAMRANVSWERGGEGTNVGHDHNLVEPAGEREDICIFHLITSEPKYVYLFGHTKHFYDRGSNSKWKIVEYRVHIR